MNEMIVTVQVDQPMLGVIAHPEGRSWDFSWGTGHGPILLILDESGQIIGAHRDWLSVQLSDASEGVDPA